MASTAGLNALAHSVTFGINLAVFTNLAQYMYTGTKARRDYAGSHLRKWGPLYCVCLATVGVMADLIRHLINDANNWYLVGPTGDKLHFDFDSCIYSIPSVSGSSQCAQKGVPGPFQVTEENALGIDMSMYNEDGSLSVYGWVFTIMGTWTGFAFLFVGILWYTGIVGKMRRQYAQLRGTEVENQQVHEAFLTPESRPVIPMREDIEQSPAAAGFLTPFSEPSSPVAAGT